MRFALSCVLLAALVPATVSGQRVTPKRPVATYSIVAFDRDTGELGVAVQSHWFSVGAIVPWAEAGVGAVESERRADAKLPACSGHSKDTRILRLRRSPGAVLRGWAAYRKMDVDHAVLPFG